MSMFDIPTRYLLPVGLQDIDRLTDWQFVLHLRKAWPRHIQAVKFETETIPRQPCLDWRDARILVMFLIYPSRQGYSSSANSISNPLCQQFLSAIQQICRRP
jgi:hypothetical protein